MVKEIRPGDVNTDNPLAKKTVRDIGTVGIDELVKTLQSKLAEKVEKVDAKESGKTEAEGSVKDSGTKETPELKKAYFNRVGIEKNLNTSANLALRGGSGGIQDARNLKLIVLPKMEKMADPGQVATFGSKASIDAPFQSGLGDVLSRTLKEMADKPTKAQKRMDKLGEKQKLREQKFGKKVVPLDRDPNEFCQEEYEKTKKDKKVIKMFDHMNKALGTKMSLEGAPAGFDMSKAKPKPKDDDDE